MAEFKEVQEVRLVQTTFNKWGYLSNSFSFEECNSL